MDLKEQVAFVKEMLKEHGCGGRCSPQGHLKWELNDFAVMADGDHSYITCVNDKSNKEEWEYVVTSKGEQLVKDNPGWWTRNGWKLINTIISLVAIIIAIIF